MAGLFEEMDESMDVADLRMQLDTLRMQGVSAVREFEVSALFASMDNNT